MIQHANNEFHDRDSLVAYLERSAVKLATAVPMLTESEMEELAEQSGVYYIPRRSKADEIDSDEDEQWDSEETSISPDLLPVVGDREDHKEEADSTPQHTQATEDAAAEDKRDTPSEPIARLQELVARAKYGDSEAVESIRAELDSNPTLWQTVGDLAGHAEQLLINVIADGNVLVSESMLREVQRLKTELADGVEPAPLERLTIQRVVACWLMCQYTDRSTLAADAAGARAASWGKRQEWAERRYQLAIKSLELARRLSPGKASTAPTSKVASESNLERNGNGTLPEVGNQDSPCNGCQKNGASEEKCGGQVNRVRDVLTQDKIPVG